MEECRGQRTTITNVIYLNNHQSDREVRSLRAISTCKSFSDLIVGRCIDFCYTVLYHHDIVFIAVYLPVVLELVLYDPFKIELFEDG